MIELSSNEFRLKLKTRFQINPQAPVAQKVADEVVFDASEVKESSFFKSDLTDPPSDF